MAAIEVLRRGFIARGWFDDATHAVVVAVSRLTPGTNIIAYCAGIGWHFNRLPGSIAAVAAASVPSALMVLVLSAAVVRVDRYRSVRALLAAGALVAAALVFSSAWHLLRPYAGRNDRGRTAILVAVAGGLYFLDLSPVRVLLTAAAIGFALPPRQRS